MKGLIKTGGMTALAISALLAMNCTSEEKSADYIGPSQIEIKDGKMTPEALLAFGRLSDPQLSPDGKHILYGVSYTSIEDNRSCRNQCRRDRATTADQGRQEHQLRQMD
mgnify:CR=1 FL=1